MDTDSQADGFIIGLEREPGRKIDMIASNARSYGVVAGSRLAVDDEDPNLLLPWGDITESTHAVMATVSAQGVI